MVFIREFELYESDGIMLAVPLDMEGGTFGENLQDAVESATDWLYETVINDLAFGRSTPGGRLGHHPQHGGRVIAVSVNADLTRATAMTAADAARMLGVSSARVAQMCERGQLVSWREGSKRMILRDSVLARLEKAPRRGRPRKNAAQA